MDRVLLVCILTFGIAKISAGSSVSATSSYANPQYSTNTFVISSVEIGISLTTITYLVVAPNPDGTGVSTTIVNATGVNNPSTPTTSPANKVSTTRGGCIILLSLIGWILGYCTFGI